MIYYLSKNGKLVYVTNKSPWTGRGPKVWAPIEDHNGNLVDFDDVKDNWELKTLEEAEQIAAIANTITGFTDWFAYDDGECVSPRFGLAHFPQVGDEVSKGFNGDYYYVGKIERITPTGVCVVRGEQGDVSRFNRVRKTAGWKKSGGTWWMVRGVHNELNPHF